MKAKLKVVEVLRKEGYETLKMSPVCKSSYAASGTDEDNTYAMFTPSGSLELNVTNPDLLGKFNPGDVYYVNFTKVEN